MDVLGALLQLGEGASASRASAYSGLSTSTRTERSPWTMNGLAGSNAGRSKCRGRVAPRGLCLVVVGMITVSLGVRS